MRAFVPLMCSEPGQTVEEFKRELAALTLPPQRMHDEALTWTRCGCGLCTAKREAYERSRPPPTHIPR